MDTRDRLWASFLRTRIRVFDRDSVTEITIGDEPAPAAGRGELVHVVTAWNPFGSELTPVANHDRQLRFEQQLEASNFGWVPAVGVAEDGRWAELGAAVTGLTRPVAVQLGRHWEQEAVFEWDPSHGVIRVVSCVDDRVVARTASAAGSPVRPCPQRPHPGLLDAVACELCRGRPGPDGH